MKRLHNEGAIQGSILCSGGENFAKPNKCALMGCLINMWCALDIKQGKTLATREHTYQW